VIGIIKDDYMKIEDFCKRTGISYDRLNKLEGAIVAKIHNEVKGSNIDCDSYKGGHTSERVFYYLEGKTVKICDIF